MATKAPAKKSTTKNTTSTPSKAPAAKAAKAPEKEMKKKDDCCGKHDDACCGSGTCAHDDLADTLEAEMGNDACCGGHDHHHGHDHEAVHMTKVKPRKPNTSGVAEDGNLVVIHYTGSLDDGEVFDTSKDREPIEFVLGAHSVIPGFEKTVLGMKIGEKKKAVIEAVDAYGDPNPQLMQEVPREALGDITPEEGMMLALHHPMSPQPIPVKVAKVSESTVTIDMNHPLAGKRLHFEVELIEIK